MNKFLVLIIILVSVGLFFVWQNKSGRGLIESPASQLTVRERSLDKYTIDALSKTKFEASEITLGKVLEERDDSTSYFFYLWVDGRRVSGLVNIPKTSVEYPVLVMFRGYVDKEIYTTGIGTQRAGEVFAKNGFITLAPDFLGYGESDNPSENPIEERFQTYVTALTLLASVSNLNSTFSVNKLSVRVDPAKVGIWGHSNGGQIALTILEITRRSIPTVLWAPVSKPFPYSILYYTDEFDDRGKMLRRVIAEFEKDYDVELYNLTNFFDRINAPIQIHQGAADDSVPQKWSDQLVSELEKLEKDVEYFTYSGADHNLLPGGWNLAVTRAIDFYSQNYLFLLPNLQESPSDKY